MAYAFDQSDPGMEAALRRIARHELAAAYGYVAPKTPLSVTAVHEIRKHLKKTRAVLRLVRSGFPDFRAENAALRTIGRALSATRECDVRLATFDRLTQDKTQDDLPVLRARLAADAGTAATLPPGFAADLHSLVRRSRSWTLHGSGRKAVLSGLIGNRQNARRALHLASRDMSAAEPVHELRKHAKDHWYHARLFTPVWPEVMTPIADAADRLGEALGDFRDITLLEAHVAGLHDLTPPARAAFDVRAASARVELQGVAMPLAHRLFAGDAREIAAVWMDWRRVWRQAEVQTIS